jgi:hypothetical protein
MAQTGYTPIQLYRTTTSGAAPLAANLQQGELAININDADMALYAENASGTVKRLMNNPAGLKYPTVDGTANQVMVTNGSGVLSWAAGPSGTYLPFSGGTMTGAITFAAGQTVDGTNKIGYLNIPLSGIKTASYTLVASDVGKFIELGTSGSVVVPASVFAAGDAISIFNNTSASISCTCSAITTVYKGGTDADISTFSVTTRGVATILFITATVAVVTGNLA